MSRKKLILSILLMLFLLVVGIALPTYFRKQREDTPTPEAKVPTSERDGAFRNGACGYGI